MSPGQSEKSAAGRKRDADAHDRLLSAAFDLTSARSSTNVSVNEIAREARVGKQTIYRWWPSKSELILDALLQRTLEQTPFPHTSDARSDFAKHLAEIIDMFNSPAGAVIKELVAGAQNEPGLTEQFVRRFWTPRRSLSRERLEQAIADRQVRSDLDPETVLDAMYGVLWTRLVLGHLPLRREDVDDLVTVVWKGIGGPEPDPVG
ncbi:TetR/AcrR family transcriptional regulator [Nocardioides sp.]|uniref:TetR/AcrR family transcriptional regulator n=1 Tax=Nocardioides sp. TaxID=35761 RepID=UPI003783A387